MSDSLPDAHSLAAKVPIRLAGSGATQIAGLQPHRMAGQGDAFWQYRPAQPGDPAQTIDWRRSSRGDALQVRQTEWQVAREVGIWVDDAPSMSFVSTGPSKPAYAARLAEAAALSLTAHGTIVRRDARRPDGLALGRHSLAVLVSDLWTDVERIRNAVRDYAKRGIGGVLLHLLDPAERDFPYRGHLRLTGATPPVDLPDAAAAAAHYRHKLAARRQSMQQMLVQKNWRFRALETDLPLLEALRGLRDDLEQLP